MNTGIYTAEELPGWDALVAASDQGTVFSSMPWLRLTAQQHGAELRVLAATYGDDILAAVPLLKRKKLSYSISTTTSLSPYNGLLLAPKLSSEHHMHDALRTLLSEGLSEFGFVSLGLHPSVSDMRPFMWKGWQVRKLYTYWVDITSAETVWNNFSQSLRRKVRRAHDDGITVREYADASLLVEQYAYSYKRHGITEPIPVQDLKAWVTSLLDAGHARMFAAFSADGIPLASRLVLPDAPFVYDWLAGSSEAGDAQSANHTLVADIMDHYATAGFSTFDFRGANTPGVIDFKRSFGGLLISYSQAEFRNSSLLSLAEKVQSVLTSLRRGL